jgi:hypothetical protein
MESCLTLKTICESTGKTKKLTLPRVYYRAVLVHLRPKSVLILK